MQSFGLSNCLLNSLCITMIWELSINCECCSLFSARFISQQHCGMLSTLLKVIHLEMGPQAMVWNATLMSY